MTAALSEEQYQQLRTDLKEEVVAEVKEDIHDELSSLTSSEGEVEVRSDNDNAALEDVWIADIPLGKLLSNALQNSSDALKGIRNGSSVENSEGSGNENESEDDVLPIERLIRLREQDENHPALPKNGRESFDRAVSIFENFSKWSKKTPKGRVVKDGLKKLLETATGEKLAWRQIYRAMDKLDEWTKGVIRHETTNRHGHVLVMNERASSVAKGG